MRDGLSVELNFMAGVPKEGGHESSIRFHMHAAGKLICEATLS